MLKKKINICYSPSGRSVSGKSVPEVLSTAQGRRPRAVLKTEGTGFPYTDQPRPVNNVFIFFCNSGGGTRRIGLRIVCKQSFYGR